MHESGFEHTDKINIIYSFRLDNRAERIQGCLPEASIPDILTAVLYLATVYRGPPQIPIYKGTEPNILGGVIM